MSRTIAQIYRELVSHPFFPLLFISEAIKAAVLGGPVVRLTLLAIAATILWAASDKVDVDVNVTDNGIIK